MTSEDIQKVISLMEQHGIAAFEYEHGSVHLCLTLGPDGAQSALDAPNTTDEAERDIIRSPGVGIVLHAHPSNSPGPPSLPRKVLKGEIVAYIRTGLTLRAAPSGRDGVLTRTIAAEGAAVGYGDPLFELTH